MTENSGFKAKTLKRKNLKGLQLAKPPTSVQEERHRDSIGEQLSTLEIGVEFKLDLRAEDLKVVNELGAGNGGTVSMVIHAPTKTMMAKKVCGAGLRSAGQGPGGVGLIANWGCRRLSI